MTGNTAEGNPVRILVVDPDERTREIVRGTLSAHPIEAEIRECSSGLEAIAAMNGFKPEILIAEVETPGIDAFELLDVVVPKYRPATVLMSSLDRFAARAFEVLAADYILKPVTPERLLRAFERARNEVEACRVPAAGPRRDAKPLMIRSGRSVFFVKTEELDWVEAEGKYVRLHMGKEFLTVKMSISALEAGLDPERFVRIHRSTLVNIDRVRRVQPWDHRRTYRVTLLDGTTLVLSRRSRLAQISTQAIPGVSEPA